MEELNSKQEDDMLEQSIDNKKDKLEDIIEDLPTSLCEWCGQELNENHNDGMCKYLNR